MYLARFSSGESPRAFWESEYAGLERLPRELLRTIYRRSPAHVLADAELPREGLVLDAGSGPGLLALAQTAEARRIWGLDCSEALLELGRRLNPGVRFEPGSLDALPFPDCTFDAYVAISSFEFSPGGLAPALQEARRVLKPGGMLLAVCLRPPVDAILGLSRRVSSTAGTFTVEHIDRVPVLMPADGFGIYYRSRELAAAATGAGFVAVRRSRADALGGLAYAELARPIRAPLLDWLGRRALTEPMTARERLVDDALLREHGPAFDRFGPLLRGARALVSYWNVIRATRPRPQM